MLTKRGCGSRVRSHWVHVARTDDLTHYGYDARRGESAMDAIGILPAFTGVCVRDGWLSYDKYRSATHALCNVHILRELVYVEEVSAEQQQWTRPLAKLLLDIKAAVEEAKSHKLSTFGRRATRGFHRALRHCGEARSTPQPAAEASAA